MRSKVGDRRAHVLGWDGQDFHLDVEGLGLVVLRDARIVGYEPGKMEGAGIEVTPIEFVEIVRE